EYNYQGKIEKEQYKAAKYYQGFVPILPNIFYDLQNKLILKEKNKKYSTTTKNLKS
ncbi:792_t:CDS:1, partial [Gigaspora margarita]